MVKAHDWDQSRWIALMLLTTSTKGRKWNRIVKRARGLGFKETVVLCQWGMKTNEGVPGKEPKVTSDRLFDSPSKLPSIRL